MTPYRCTICGYLYDPGIGVPETGIPPGTPFEELPGDFTCPVCGADKECFTPEPAAESTGSAARVVELAATVLEVIQRTPTVKSVRVAAEHGGLFKPGQYLSIALGDDPSLTRQLSISSSPTEAGYLEVTKRITRSRFAELLNSLRPGSQVRVRYPMGSFTFEGQFDKLGLLCGGIGITPLRSICRYIVDRGWKTDVRLIYSNRDEGEIAFESDFAAMAEACRSLRVAHTLTRAGSDWTGRRGRIDAALVKAEIPDYLDRHFYVCGPPQMVTVLTSILRYELGLPEQMISTEDFIGY